MLGNGVEMLPSIVHILLVKVALEHNVGLKQPGSVPVASLEGTIWKE